MRIAVINNFYPPRTGGSAHLSEAIARILVDRGHQVLVVTGSYGDAPPEETHGDYRIVRLKSRTLPEWKFAFNFDINFAASPANVRRLFRLLDDFRPQVIHQHGQFFDLTFASSWYARRRKLPVVLSVHTRLESPSRLHDLVFLLGDTVLVRLFLAMSKPHVVVMDRLMQGYITRRYRIPTHRQVPIPVGIDPSRFSGPIERDVRSELGLNSRPVILSLGHVIPVRDRLALVEAMPHVLVEQPEAMFVIVGRVYDDRFLHRADELGVRDHVVVTGAIPKDEVPSYVAAADIEAHDLSGYGLGTASLEVMAAGVPCVVAVRADNFPGVQLRSWENVVLVEPDDPIDLAKAINRLLVDPELRSRVAKGQQSLVRESFSIDAVVDRHEDLYRQLAIT